MSLLHKGLLAVAIAGGVLVAQTGSAWALSEDVGGTFKYRLKSHTWHQGAGATSIDIRCDEASRGKRYTIALWSEGWGDDVSVGGTVSAVCGSDAFGEWTVKAGDYHLVFTKGDDQQSITVQGDVNYPDPN